MPAYRIIISEEVHLFMFYNSNLKECRCSWFMLMIIIIYNKTNNPKLIEKLKKYKAVTSRLASKFIPIRLI